MTKTNKRSIRYHTIKKIHHSKLPNMGSKSLIRNRNMNYTRKNNKNITIPNISEQSDMAYDIRYKYYIDTKLCVFPSTEIKDQESQYEAFQSIFAKIMSATIKNSNNSVSTPYEELCAKYNIKLVPSSTTPTGIKKDDVVIFFKPSGVTHYKAVVNGEVKDPYKYYQANGTQGFCQMFAFLLAIGDTDGFENVKQNPVINLTSNETDYINFNRLVANSQLCFKKSLKYITGEVYNLFKKDFDIIVRSEYKKYGIKPGTLLSRYLLDFQKINNNILAVSDYIYDQPINIKGKKDNLWYYIHPTYNNI